MNSKLLFDSNYIMQLFSADKVVWYFTIYIVINIIVSALVWRLLPAKYRYPSYLSFVLLFSFTFFMPIVGMLGLVFFILPSLYFPKKQQEKVINIKDKIGLPYTNLENLDSVLFNDGSLYDVINLQNDSNKSLKALLAIGNMSHKDATPILQKALHNQNDDIRLLAYATLDQYESYINAEIEQAQAQLVTAQGAYKAQLHNMIGHHYWELAYLGLAQGAVLEYVLEQAYLYIKKAISFSNTPELQLQQGRISLRQQELEQAQSNFEQALAMGMDKQQVLPYLAEVAYMMGQYNKIPALLAQLPKAVSQHEPFLEIMSYWHVNT